MATLVSDNVDHYRLKKAKLEKWLAETFAEYEEKHGKIDFKVKVTITWQDLPRMILNANRSQLIGEKFRFYAPRKLTEVTHTL